MSGSLRHQDLFSPPAVVRDFCLDELYPQFLFRYLPPRDPIGDGSELLLCGLVHSTSPANFYVQLDADRRLSDRMSYRFAQIYDIQMKSEEYVVTEELLHPGVPVTARYMVDEDFRWFRAIIIGVDRTPGKERPIRIMFIDFGNEQQNEIAHLRMIPTELGKEPPLGIRCRLKGTSENDVLPKTINNNFADWGISTLESYRCLVKFGTYDSSAQQHIVRVFNAKDGREYLLPPEYQTVPNAPPKSSTVATDHIVADLLKLDLESGDNQGGEVRRGYGDAATDDLLGTTSSAPAAVGTASAGVTMQSSTMNELKSVFVGQNTSAFADLRKMPKTGETASNDATKGDGSRGREGTNTGPPTSGNGTGGGSGQYDPFEDPQFKPLMEKYPNLMKYLRCGDSEDSTRK